MQNYQHFIHKSRYSRYIDKLKRREHWYETVDRYIKFICNNIKIKFDYDIDNELKAELRRYILEMKVMPSMRAMMTAGPAAERQNMAAFNCSYLPIDDIKCFDELMYILLCGTGVGFSVESSYTNKLPEVPDQLFQSDTTIVVADSKEGWAKSLRQLISLLYAGEIPKFDFSKVRPAGARLKTFGGRASGPKPLNELFNFVTGVFRASVGRRLHPIECHDICCKIAEVVVVGGVRRSALISLSDLSDARMSHAKSGAWWETNGQRSLANNSAVYKEKPSMSEFMREWQSLYESKSGERGIFNRDATNRQVAKNGRRDTEHHFGTNPSLRKGTKVWTEAGIFPIEQLDGKTFYVKNLNGEISEAKCWLSGKQKQLYKITLSGGHEYYCTPEHEWPVLKNNKWVKISTPDLVSGDFLPILKQNSVFSGSLGDEDDGFIIGWNLGDGWITERKNGNQIGFIVSEKDKQSGIHIYIEDYLKSRCNWTGTYSDKNEINVNNTLLRDIFNDFGVNHKSLGLPTKLWSSCSESFVKGLISGLFSADGCFSDRIILTSAYELLIKDVASVLGFYGIKTTIKTSTSEKVVFPNGKNYNKSYTRYDLQISDQKSIKHFDSIFNIYHEEKNKSLKNLIKDTKGEKSIDKVKIKSIELTDTYEDVWDISVKDETHCFQIDHCITGNCSEIILRPYEVCNLTEVIVRSEDTAEDLRAKMRIATILGTFQSTLTDFPYLRKIWQKNAEEERLLGVSLTGIYDNKLTYRNNNDLEGLLLELKQIAVETNKIWAGRLGINPSTAITAVKPSGTVSSLCDTASGIHTRHAEYYIRTVRSDVKDPLTNFLINIGIPYEPCVMRPDSTAVFSFPMKAPDGAMTRKDISAIEHLGLWLTYQRYYCEHKPSVTISVKEDEWMLVGAWVWDHFDEVTGISFLPYSDHNYKQAPYSECTKEEYEAALAVMPPDIDWEQFIETDDNVEGAQTLACTGGSCDI